jgi:hypothetical protein
MLLRQILHCVKAGRPSYDFWVRFAEGENKVAAFILLVLICAYGKYCFSLKADPPSYDFWVRFAEGENKMAGKI